jgi:hypothetical protein
LRTGPRTAEEATSDLVWFQELFDLRLPADVASGATERILAEDDAEMLALLQVLLFDGRPLAGPEPDRDSCVAERVCEAVAERYATEAERRRLLWSLPDPSQRLAYWQMRFVVRCREAFLPEPSWTGPRIDSVALPTGQKVYFTGARRHRDLWHALVRWSGNVFDLGYSGRDSRTPLPDGGASVPLPALGEVPVGLRPLRYLLWLELSDAGLRVLPSDLSCWPSLIRLDLHGNELASLPPSIGSLTGLSFLDLCSNELRALPDEIGHLSRLESLRLSLNPLESLPDSMVHLRSLARLDLDGTLIPRAEVEELRRCMPGVDIRFRQGD